MEDTFAGAVEASSDEYQQMSDEMNRATELAYEVSNAYNGVSSAVANASNALSNFEAPDWETLSATIDSIQDSFKNLTSAMQEYNTSGYLSIDTLQSLLAMDSDYLACLEMQNGKLILNADAFQIATMAQLDNARAEAVNQYATELQSIAQRDSTAATVASIGATADQVEALAVLSQVLGNTTASTIGYAKAQELLSLYEAANTKSATETAKATDAFNARMALIDQVAAQASGGISGLTKTLGEYSDTAADANKQLEKQQNLLKIRGQAAVDAPDKQTARSNQVSSFTNIPQPVSGLLLFSASPQNMYFC